MIAGSLARRYARAIFDLGTAKGNLEQLARELEGLAANYSASRELAEALTNPVFPRSQRRAVLEAVVQRVAVTPTTRNFVLLLHDRERIQYLPAIARELRVMVDEKAGRVRAQVTGARPVAPEHGAKIRSALEQATGKTVVLETKQDPEILGGIVAQVGDVVYDGSIRTQLELLRERALA
ncbi:MAG: ATP synthase F1 subunit delta [Deltaproteobacteria bacterium]|nr:ATP synthase F1 subunit delta [Deltaproteobacteria bacterium]